MSENDIKPPETTKTTPVESQSNTESTTPVESQSEVTLLNKRNENEKLNAILKFNAAYYIFIFVIIGLPIWYFTVSTYRSSLPFNEIDRLSGLDKFELQVKFDLISNSPSDLDTEFLNLMSQNMHDNDGMVFDFKATSRKYTQVERDHALASKNIEELDKRLNSANLDTLTVYILDNSFTETLNIDKKSYLLLNNLYILEDDVRDLSDVVDFILTEYLHAKRLTDRVKSKLNIKRNLPTKEDLKVMHFDSDYEITFSLINSKPEAHSDWNINHCIEKYFQKIVDQLEPYTNFSIKVQTLLYSDFDSYPMPMTRDNANNEAYYYLKPTDLSIMTNHFENRLGSRISDSSALEFVVYVPPKGPLFFKSKPNDVNSDKTNAFLVPKWGGVYIYNHLSSETNTIRIDEGMKYFLTQFIDLIGIKLNKNPGIVRSQIYPTEIYSYLLANTMDNLLTSINTLKSLSSLLIRIQEMVIEDNIADKVRMSTEAAQRCVDLLREGDLEGAFFESKNAYMHSEKAFFDQSLLGQLYFPEDQRFAIYMPLFIPVGIPLALSFKSFLTTFIKNRKLNGKQKSE